MPETEHTRRSRLLTQPYVLGLGRFARRLPALLAVLFFLAIAWFDFGSGLNVPATFWDGGVGAGLSVALLFAYVWLVTYVLDTTFDRETLVSGPEDHGWLTRLASRVFPTRGVRPEPAAVRLRAYMVVTFAPCLLLMVVATFLRVGGKPPFVHVYPADPYVADPQPLILTRWRLLVGLLAGVLVLRVLHLIGGRVFAHWSGFVTRYSLLHRLTRSDDRWVRAVVEGVFLAQAVAFAACVVSVRYDWWYPPPITAVCMFFGLLVGVSGFVWYHARRVALPAFAALLLVVYAANDRPYKLRFPHMDPEYEARVRLEDREEPAGDWDAIKEQVRGDEWNRVARLTDLRIRSLKHGTELSNQLGALKTRPQDGASYRELLKLYTAVTDQAEADEWDALGAWRDAAPKTATGKPKLVVVTVTGGANRSGLWTTKVLHELHQQLPDFPKHVRLVAGASGGMVGATYYVGSLGDGGELPDGFDPRDMAQDHIVPVMSSMVFREVPFLPLPVEHYTHDRGHALDLSFEGSSADEPVRGRLRRAFGQTFPSLRAGEDAGWRPPLVFTPMMIEDGRRLFISNRSVHYLTTSVGNILLGDPLPREARSPDAVPVAASQQRGFKQLPPDEPARTNDDRGAPRPRAERVLRLRAGNPDVYGRSGVEFFHLFPEARDRFHVSTAARMSATFPILSPAVDLPTEPPRRVVDAGYYDNYGVGTAAAWLSFWRSWLLENTSGVMVIQIRDSASQHDRRHLARQAEVDDRPGGASPLAWFTGPLAAVDKARQSTSSFRNDELLSRLDEHFKSRKPDDPRFFQTVVFERYSNVGMSWFLNAEDKRQIIASWKDDPPNGQLNTNPRSLELLKTWWNER